MLGYPPPPWDQAEPPGSDPPGSDTPQTRQTPRVRHHPPGSDTPPRTWQTHLGPGRPPLGPGRPPPGKQTPAYGLQAASMHPTGMHSCPVMNSSSSVTAVINNCQPLVYTFIYSKYDIVKKISQYMHHIEQLLVLLTNLEPRLVTMSVSLRTQNGLGCLTIQVLNIKSLLPKYFSHFCTQ